jgi:CRISPR-associated protein Cmr3
MTTFTIDALDPLVLRDGRPNQGRSESRTLPFPLPSTLVGVVRTALGRKNGVFDERLVEALLTQVELRGPLLAGGDTLYAPAPRDAVVLSTEGGVSIWPLRPTPVPEGCAATAAPSGLSWVGLGANAPKTKPAEAPAFWLWAKLEQWLRAPNEREGEAATSLLAGGLSTLEREQRVHVALTPVGTALEGALFATEGLRLAAFERGACREHGRALELRIAVEVRITDPTLGGLSAALRPLGGERRLSSWERAPDLRLPEPPEWLLEHVAQQGALVRVVLLTPAYVASSTGPRALERSGVARIVAARVDRPLTMSGWDLRARKPKRTRRLASAGSVFWARLEGSAEERRRWVSDVWMQNVSDDDPGADAHGSLARDGFGLAAIGVGSTP